MKVRYHLMTAAAGVAVMIGGTIAPAQAANEEFRTCAGRNVVAWRTSTTGGTQADGACRNVSVRLKLRSTGRWGAITYSRNGLAERNGHNFRTRHTWKNPNNEEQAGSAALPN